MYSNSGLSGLVDGINQQHNQFRDFVRKITDDDRDYVLRMDLRLSHQVRMLWFVVFVQGVVLLILFFTYLSSR